MSNNLNKEFLAERDIRIFKLRAGGASVTDIAQALGVSMKAVSAALARQLGRLNRDAYLAYPEVLRMELERLDLLQRAIWPMTQPRQNRNDETGEVEIQDPNLDAVRTVLSIADRRAKLMGLDIAKVDISMDIQANVRSSLVGGAKEALTVHDPKHEALQLIELMTKAGVLRDERFAGMLEAARKDDDVIEAEIVPTEDRELAHGTD